MGTEISDIISGLVFLSDVDLEARLEAQADALRESGCINPILGRWVDEHEVNYLLSALALKEADFAEEFPAMAHITEQERRGFISALETHFGRCPHCSLKRGYDLEMDARIEQACEQNKSTLLQILKDDDDEADSTDESDHVSIELAPAFSSNQ